jgi:ubiquitin-activating enzyme E1
VEVDATGFHAYERQGLVENVKVAKKVAYHSLKQSIHNPTASSQYGMLETPDLRFFGRSEQLHLALRGIWQFQKEHKHLPGEGEIAHVIKYVEDINEQAKTSEGMSVEDIDFKVIRNASTYSRACISPMAAFFGGVIA